MPKKKNEESQAEQSERFKKAVRAMVDAGELSPTDAEEKLNGFVKENLIELPREKPDRQ